MLERVWRKGKLPYTVGGSVNQHSHYGKQYEGPQKTEHGATIWCSNPTPICGKHTENHNSKRHMHPNVHCSTVYNSQDRKATIMFPDKWKGKEDVIYYTQQNITQS